MRSWIRHTPRAPTSREPIGHRYEDPRSDRKTGRELGVQLAECWHKNALAGNCRSAGGASFEEWLDVLCRGDTQAEIAGRERYKALIAAYKAAT